MTEPATETARGLLDRHGLPEDVVDGALCLHAQELAAVQRAAISKTDDPVFYEGEAGWLINLIVPGDDEQPAAPAVSSPPPDQTAAAPVCKFGEGCHRVVPCEPGCGAPLPDQTLRDRIAAVLREHYLCTNRDEADADGNLPCRCGAWREPGAEADDENDWDGHLADAALAVLPADRGADDLAIARATNQRLNLRAQRLESELAAYRRAVADWEITDTGTYVPLRTLAAIAKAAGLDVPDRWELHYERVEHAEAELRRLVAEAQQQPTDQDVVEAHRLALSFALGLGTGAPWDAIRDQAAEPHAAEARQQPEALPPTEGPEYTPCACGHIEPEHRRQRPGWTREACYKCPCVDYAPVAQQPEEPVAAGEPTAEEIVRGHVLALHQIGEQLSQIESWFWGHLADVREAARQELGGPLPDDAVPVQHAAADNGEETAAIRLDEDGRDVETGHEPGCASQSYPDPGICYCEETGRG